MTELHLPERLETVRLCLRRLVPGDAAIMHETYTTDPETVKFLSWVRHETLAETEAVVERFGEWWDEPGGEKVLAICRRTEPARPIGTIGCRRKGDAVSFGYVIGREFWGKGYVTEALAAIRDLCFADPKIRRFWAWCDVENIASARVMEKAGLALESRKPRYSVMPNLGPDARDCLIYAMERP